ncbi:NAD(P) transhydrogenase subunit alpha [Haloplanus aerogenes]|uniref:proton-translocating NAD(P)(+) transhydrogenase n=1 Tax=Haloplanus aerogenes TaxID=660522 RepID=A0A3M0D980_9EURY|nr:NAD(P) transhydrogenase subunit alpha [Haloplanus aerogenes]AZH26535.1 NAD(P) transhydrogenase subunit alpha [Haloplanus aerogenes]RMB12763.1 NAD(P) transhydrogenase alpha subunit [Haloplanus aerogenes]
MIVGVPGETASDETRVALIPPVAKKLIDRDVTVCVASGAGEGSDWSDEAYREVGCDVVEDRADVFERADVICQISGLAANADEPMDPYREGQTVIATLGPYDLTDETYEELERRRVSAFALELMPRISRAQSMDVLSSMASIGGYKATLVTAEQLPKLFPLEMTAAGTVRPAEVFVIGAGVAGLKAIATAERLGASVKGYDIRLEVKQEVESLGADFVELDLETEGSGDDEGYAVEMGEEFYEQQRKELSRVVPESDVVITTAAIPGAPAPELVSAEMIEGMDDGSVIVDLSAPTGGNCEPTVAGETIEHEGVTIFGPTNLPATVPQTASQLFANNLYNFLDHLLDDDSELVLDTDDEIVDSTLLTHDGTIRRPHEDGGETDDEDDDAAADDEPVEDEADA